MLASLRLFDARTARPTAARLLSSLCGSVSRCQSRRSSPSPSSSSPPRRSSAAHAPKTRSPHLSSTHTNAHTHTRTHTCTRAFCGARPLTRPGRVPPRGTTSRPSGSARSLRRRRRRSSEAHPTTRRRPACPPGPPPPPPPPLRRHEECGIGDQAHLLRRAKRRLGARLRPRWRGRAAGPRAGQQRRVNSGRGTQPAQALIRFRGFCRYLCV